MKVVFAASEMVPFIKIGGLGDVAGSLPKAVAALGQEVTVVIPNYSLIDQAKWGIQRAHEFAMLFAAKEETVTVSKATLPESNVAVLFLGNDQYLSGGGKDAFAGTVSEADRFAFFSKALVTLIKSGNMPELTAVDIVHLNDWHTSMVPVLWKLTNTASKPPAFLLSIHNLSYQGVTDLTILDKLGIKAGDNDELKWDAANNDIDMLLQGILHADAINTVSENYAKEILTDAFSEGLGEILRRRQDRLFGIVNGIDYRLWDPSTDTAIAKPYTIESLKTAKPVNRTALQANLGLAQDDKPIISFIGRIEPKQKGIDLIYDWLKERIRNQESGIKEKIQFVLLGTGDKEWEEKLRKLVPSNEQWLSVNLAFDEKLAHQIYAGSDYILMPSKFEPCGLPQMIALHYGTLPIVHGVGGLKDTVLDGWTGFLFQDYSVSAMEAKIAQAVEIYNTDAYWKMARQGMKQNFSWDASAKKYLNLYKKTIQFASA